MKNYLFFFITASGLLLPASALSNAGPPIPVPQISIVEACTVAMDYFYVKETHLIDPEQVRAQEYIIFSANYTNQFPDNPENEWAWKIVFVHPVHNDHSVAYKITIDKKIILLHTTE